MFNYLLLFSFCRLPMSHTCFNQLMLPNYEKKEILSNSNIYMEACTKFRSEATNESSRLFFKTSANGPFGKSMESDIIM